MVRIVLASLVFATIAFAGVSLVVRSTGMTSQAYAFPAVASVPLTGTPVLPDSGDADSTSTVDADTAARIIAGIENFVAARNAGDYEGYAALLTENRMRVEAGTANPADVVAGLEAFNLPITILSLGDVRAHSDGRLSAEFVHLFGDHLYYRSRIYVIVEDGVVKFDEERYLPEEPQGTQALVELSLVDFAFQLDRSSVRNAQFIVLRGHNRGAVPHEIVMVRLPDGVTPEQALTGEVDESQIEFIGQADLAAGASDDLVLANLEPGVYTLLCLLNGADGIPHAAHGMVAQLTVEGPATPTASGG